MEDKMDSDSGQKMEWWPKEGYQKGIALGTYIFIAAILFAAAYGFFHGFTQ